MESGVDKEIKLNPLVGWEIGSLPGANVMVALQYVTSEGELLAKTPHSLRLAMSAAQCDQLAETLRRKAVEAREREKRESGHA